jgi:DNA-binding GntR family transcriptional regulator
MEVPLHEQLRLELLSGMYAPGERLKVARLCETYGVSLSVIREALTRLSEQGLVRAERHRGFAAIPLDMADLEDLTAARVQIETVCLRRSIARGDMDWEGAVVSAQYRLSRTPIATFGDDPDQARAWADAHSAFHAALCAACASPRLLELRQQLFDATEIYRVWLSQRMVGVRDDTGEHQEIAEAVLGRETERACDLISAHVIETSEQLPWSPLADGGPGAAAQG